MTENLIDFNDFPWYGASLLDVSIDRHDPGEHDEVSISVKWSNGTETCFLFLDCYAAEVRMNFGVVAPESIQDARCIHESLELTDMRQKWARVGVNLSDLRCFQISTISTASTIRIFALRCLAQ